MSSFAGAGGGRTTGYTSSLEARRRCWSSSRIGNDIGADFLQRLDEIATRGASRQVDRPPYCIVYIIVQL